MSFQNPALLWLFAPLGGTILALYLLRMRRQDVRIPASFLWPSHTEEIRANSLFQKLRFNWLLVLQLLIAALACVALARPQFKQKGLLGTTTVIIIDNSASMRATDVSPNRLEQAKSLANEAVSSAGIGDQIAILTAANVPKVVSPLSNDPGAHRAALSQLKPTDTEGDMAEALRLAAALVSGIDGARILILSDGCFTKISDFSPGKAAVVYKSIGVRQENLAIQSLGATKSPKGTEVYCGVKNFGLNEAKTEVAIYADNKLIQAQKITIPSLKSAGIRCFAPAGTKVLRAEISTNDLLQADNRLTTLVDPNANLSVLLVAKGDPFLERALLLDTRVSLDTAKELPLSEGKGKPSKYDLIIFDGVPVQPVESRGVVSLGNGAVKIDGPKADDVKAHPLLAETGLETLYIDSSKKLDFPAEAVVIASSKDRPLVAIQEGEQKRVWVGFEPMNSDFPLQVGFPIFVSNLLDFVGSGSQEGEMVASTGRSFLYRTNTKIALKTPKEWTRELEPTDGVITLPGLQEAGQYSLGDKKLTVNLRSDIESDIAVKPDLVLGQSPVKTTQTPYRLADIWRFLALAALGLLAFEWWFYARKS
ncbi:MAG: BatA and WFA domain-containing protein [Armatimonadota bacterium]